MDIHMIPCISTCCGPQHRLWWYRSQTSTWPLGQHGSRTPAWPLAAAQLTNINMASGGTGRLHQHGPWQQSGSTITASHTRLCCRVSGSALSTSKLVSVPPSFPPLCGAFSRHSGIGKCSVPRRTFFFVQQFYMQIYIAMSWSGSRFLVSGAP